MKTALEFFLVWCILIIYTMLIISVRYMYGLLMAIEIIAIITAPIIAIWQLRYIFNKVTTWKVLPLKFL